MWHVVNNEHHVFGKISIFTTRSDSAVIRVMHGPWSTLLYWVTGNASSWHQLFCKFNPTKSAKKERKKEESQSLGTGGMIGVWMSLSRALLSPHETQWIVLPRIISIQAIFIAWELLGHRSILLHPVLASSFPLGQKLSKGAMSNIVTKSLVTTSFSRKGRFH